jgi:hypothetical protein
MNYYLIMELPLFGTIHMPLSLVLGGIAFTFGMLAFVGLIIAGEMDNRRANDDRRNS